MEGHLVNLAQLTYAHFLRSRLFFCALLLSDSIEQSFASFPEGGGIRSKKSISASPSSLPLFCSKAAIR